MPKSDTHILHGGASLQLDSAPFLRNEKKYKPLTERKEDFGPLTTLKLALSLSVELSPPFKPVKVNLRPSPEPYPLPLPPSPPPGPDGRARKRKKTRTVQSTRADAVLVNFLGDQNRPDIASHAGEHPLVTDLSGDVPESPSGEGSDEEMEVLGPERAPTTQSLVQVAESTLRITEHNDARRERSAGRSASERPRPIIVTRPSSQAEAAFLREAAPKPSHSFQNSNAPTNAAPHVPRESSGGERPSSSQQSPLNPVREQNSMMTSPRLRQFTISASDRSPMETLPAMQNSPPPSAMSQGTQQILPSLHSQLGPLADGPPLPQPLALTKRQPSFSGNGTLHSPPLDFSPPRGPPPYPPLSALNRGKYPVYPATEPSPASTQSGPSPRESYTSGRTPRSMSPPPKFGPRQYSGTQSLIHSDAPTPVSATGQTSLGTLCTEPSPVSERLNLNSDRPILPPLPNGPLVGGGFRCEVPGCTAPPFQTQYLLK